MAALGALPGDALEGYVVMGELALDGTIAPVAGALPAAIGANALGKGLICPARQRLGSGLGGPGHGRTGPAFADRHGEPFQGRRKAVPPRTEGARRVNDSGDLSDIRGQETAKRALEVAAAGGHNLVLVGPPGSGKSMLASRLPTILPPLTPRELLEVSMIASIAGTIADGKLSSARPFRAPHHSASMAAMVGGGIRGQAGRGVAGP